MRKVLLSTILLMLFNLQITAQRTIYSLVERITFVTAYEEPHGAQIGTAFCMPGRSNVLLTAGHVIGPGLEVYDHLKKPHEIVAIFKSDKTDIAVITLKDSPCELSTLKWAVKNALVGTKIWLYGYGGALANPLLTTGIISGKTGTIDKFPERQVAQLNASYGHSGGPVLNDIGEVVGMLVGGFRSGADMNIIIPVEAIKKAIK